MMDRKSDQKLFDGKNIYPNATRLNLPKIKQFSIQKPLQVPISQGFLVWTICRTLKNEDAETSPFPKLPLEI